MGIKEDLGLVDDQYSWLGSLFYFGGISNENLYAEFCLLI